MDADDAWIAQRSKVLAARRELGWSYYATNPAVSQHGVAAYNKGCRCKRCRRAKRDMQQQVRANRKAVA